MSGPGTGAWTWLIAVLERIATHSSINVSVFIRKDWVSQLPPIAGLRVGLVPERGRISTLLFTGREIRTLVKEYKLDAVHFCTLPVPPRVPCSVFYTLHDLRYHYPKKNRW